MPDTVVGLTTLEKLRMHVLRDSADESSDEKLTFYGEAMSQRVADYCEAEFLPDPADENGDPVTRSFFYDGSGALDLRPYELREVVTVTLHSDQGTDTDQEVAVADYRLSPRGRTRDGTYLSVDLLVPCRPPAHFGFGWTIEIEGRWGMLTVPKPIELAVLVAVDDVMLNPASLASQDLGGYSITADDLDPGFDASDRGGLPRAALWACAPYRQRRRRRVRSVALRHPRAWRAPQLP